MLIPLHAAEHPPKPQNVCFSTLIPAVISKGPFGTLPHSSYRHWTLTGSSEDVAFSAVTFQSLSGAAALLSKGTTFRV